MSATEARAFKRPPAETTAATASAVPQPPGESGGAASAGGRVDSSTLLRGRKAVEISHNGATYRLQATRLGKLILTK